MSRPARNIADNTRSTMLTKHDQSVGSSVSKTA